MESARAWTKYEEILCKCGKIRTRKTPNTENFHLVLTLLVISQKNRSLPTIRVQYYSEIHKNQVKTTGLT